MRYGLQTIHTVLMTESKGDVRSRWVIDEIEKMLRTYPRGYEGWCREVTEYNKVFVDDRKLGQLEERPSYLASAIEKDVPEIKRKKRKSCLR